MPLMLVGSTILLFKTQFTGKMSQTCFNILTNLLSLLENHMGGGWADKMYRLWLPALASNGRLKGMADALGFEPDPKVM